MLWWGYVVVMAAMVLCDLIWIGTNFKMYTDHIMAIQGTPYYNMWKIIVLPIYALMYVAVVFIALPLYPLYGLGSGAIVGFVVYGVYDLCMLLQFHNSSVGIACLDILWGTALFTGLTKLAEVMNTFTEAS